MLPLFFPFGAAPDDDVVHFLDHAGVQPVGVTVSALLLYIGGWWIFLSKVTGQAPPANYQLVATVDLAAEQRTVYTFTLDQPQVVGIYVSLAAVNADYLDLQLTGPAGDTYRLLHAEGYSAHADSAQVEANLQAGTYYCVITSRAATGDLSLYTKRRINSDFLLID